MNKVVCISTVALLITAQVPALSQVGAIPWDKVVTYGGLAIQVVTYLQDKIVGTITYTESCYVESTTLWYHGYYHDIHFWQKRASQHNPVTSTTTYSSWSLHDGVQSLDNNDPFPLEPSRQSRFCDLSTTDAQGSIVQNTYNTLERFRFAVQNKTVSQSGLFPHSGPFPTRVQWPVTPLLKDCSASESVYPVTDYLDVTIPKDGTVGGLEGALMNRRYNSPYFTRP